MPHSIQSSFYLLFQSLIWIFFILHTIFPQSILSRLSEDYFPKQVWCFTILMSDPNKIYFLTNMIKVTWVFHQRKYSAHSHIFCIFVPLGDSQINDVNGYDLIQHVLLLVSPLLILLEHTKFKKWIMIVPSCKFPWIISLLCMLLTTMLKK